MSAPLKSRMLRLLQGVSRDGVLPFTAWVDAKDVSPRELKRLSDPELHRLLADAYGGEDVLATLVQSGLGAFYRKDLGACFDAKRLDRFDRYLTRTLARRPAKAPVAAEPEARRDLWTGLGVLAALLIGGIALVAVFADIVRIAAIGAGLLALLGFLLLPVIWRHPAGRTMVRIKATALGAAIGLFLLADLLSPSGKKVFDWFGTKPKEAAAAEAPPAVVTAPPAPVRHANPGDKPGVRAYSVISNNAIGMNLFSNPVFVDGKTYAYSISFMHDAKYRTDGEYYSLAKVEIDCAAGTQDSVDITYYDADNGLLKVWQNDHAVARTPQDRAVNDFWVKYVCDPGYMTKWSTHTTDVLQMLNHPGLYPYRIGK